MRKLSLTNFKPNMLAIGASIRKGIITLLVGAAVLGGPYAAYDYHFNTETYVATVTDKYERSTGSQAAGTLQQIKRVDVAIDGDPDGETFNVSDTWIPVNRASGDTYRSLQRGGQYQITVKGWRLPFFSMFKTVTDVRNADGTALDGSNSGFELVHGNGQCSTYTPPPGYALVPIEAIEGLDKSDVVDPATIKREDTSSNGMTPR
ncbi:MAG: hypothetical protein Alpg2KO_04460 [Alphaproteobacteria bacterium]